MKRGPAFGGCWPDALQEQLLLAALTHGPQAVAAYAQWRARVDIDQLDVGSFRLVPLLFRNLCRLGIKDEKLSLFQGIYRKSWCKNQVLFRTLGEAIAQLAAAGIPTLLLKGVPLSLQQYRDIGARPMSDADVLIPDAHAELAISRLVQTGWKAKLTPLEGIQSPRQLAARGITPRPRDARQFTRVFLNVRHGHSFEKSDIAELDLHWRLFDRVVQPAADAEIWRRAVPLKLADIPTLCMDPTDQLLHVIAHGVRWNVVSPLRWVADAAMILGNSEVTIDWNRLVKDAQSQSLALPLAAGLNYLRRLLGIPIPAACLPQLRKWPGTLTQRIQHHLKLRPAGLWAGLDELVYLSRRYLQLVGRSEYPEADRGPLFFLQHVLGIDDPWQLGQYLLFEVARRSREQLTRTLPAYFLK